jgi:hypothetical protein
VSRTVKQSLTVAERKAVAETLVKWAAWCEVNPGELWWRYPPDTSERVDNAAIPWCEGAWPLGPRGPTAATGLLLAAAMVEAGDSCD